jgi:hypothetical protein
MIGKGHDNTGVQFDLQGGFTMIHDLACQEHIFVGDVGQGAGETVDLSAFLGDKDFLGEGHVNFRAMLGLEADAFAQNDDFLSVVVGEYDVIVVLSDISHHTLLLLGKKMT